MWSRLTNIKVSSQSFRRGKLDAGRSYKLSVGCHKKKEKSQDNHVTERFKMENSIKEISVAFFTCA